MARQRQQPRPGLISSDQKHLAQIANTLHALAAEMLRLEASLLQNPHSIHPQHLRSARNLAHYLVLRRHDLRKLQAELAALGLSSLGRSEGHVLNTLQNVHRMLCSAIACPDRLSRLEPPVRIGEGAALLAQNTKALLGPPHSHRSVGIMVTMSTEAATDYNLVLALVRNGMDCMRINCAHDNPRVWLDMIRNLERARAETGRTCKIQIDLAGPKLRTGSIQPGPRVLRLRPQRDAFGRVTTPARLWLVAPNSTRPGDDIPTLSLPPAFLARLRRNYRLHFHDARKSARSLKIIRIQDGRALAETRKTCYFTPGLQFNLASTDYTHRARLGEVPAQPQRLRLKPGDTLLLDRTPRPGQPAQKSPNGRRTSARIGVTLPATLRHAKPGQAIWFDDGKIGGIIRAVSTSHLRVEITQARPTGEWLGESKGINLPETRIDMPALTSADIQNFKFITTHADILGFSFARTPEDVRQLLNHLQQLDATSLPVVLKIETREAFENLPALLFEAMSLRGLGVMIARGDLAVECGYQRLAEVQEEILWICEAAHMPVIWATQVLDFLAKKGTPSRAEITDAAMAERAECVMLNKGPYIAEAVLALDDILTRMQSHQEKKRSMLRKLSIASTFALQYKNKITSRSAKTRLPAKANPDPPPAPASP